MSLTGGLCVSFNKRNGKRTSSADHDLSTCSLNKSFFLCQAWEQHLFEYAITASLRRKTCEMDGKSILPSELCLSDDPVGKRFAETGGMNNGVPDLVGLLYDGARTRTSGLTHQSLKSLKPTPLFLCLPHFQCNWRFLHSKIRWTALFEPGGGQASFDKDGLACSTQITTTGVWTFHHGRLTQGFFGMFGPLTKCWRQIVRLKGLLHRMLEFNWYRSRLNLLMVNFQIVEGPGQQPFPDGWVTGREIIIAYQTRVAVQIISMGDSHAGQKPWKVLVAKLKSVPGGMFAGGTQRGAKPVMRQLMKVRPTFGGQVLELIKRPPTDIHITCDHHRALKGLSDLQGPVDNFAI